MHVIQFEPLKYGKLIGQERYTLELLSLYNSYFEIRFRLSTIILWASGFVTNDCYFILIKSTDDVLEEVLEFLISADILFISYWLKTVKLGSIIFKHFKKVCLKASSS